MSCKVFLNLGVFWDKEHLPFLTASCTWCRLQRDQSWVIDDALWYLETFIYNGIDVMLLDLIHDIVRPVA
jgi:hypothetical protein